MNEPLFDHLESCAPFPGPDAVFDTLIETLENEQRLPQLFEAHLMKVRHELGLPLLERRALRLPLLRCGAADHRGQSLRRTVCD